MISLQVALASAKQQIEKLKDQEIKLQLLNNVNEAIEHQNDEGWTVKTFSGNEIESSEAITYEFAINEIADQQSDNYGKRLQMSVGVDKQGVFSFVYMLQGEQASRKRDIDRLKELKSGNVFSRIKNAKEIDCLEQNLYHNPLQYTFDGKTTNIAFSPVGGLSATMHKFRNGYDLRNSNEYRKWLGFAVLNDKEKIFPTSHALTTIVVTDKNYNNKLIKEVKETTGQLLIAKTETRAIERFQDNSLAYSIKNVESANGQTKIITDSVYKGKIATDNISQLNFDMAKYCTQEQEKSTSNL